MHHMYNKGIQFNLFCPYCYLYTYKAITHMYNIKYQIQFKDVNNQLYTIHIKEDNYSGSITELRGGVSPIIINYDSESDFLYNPTRLSGAVLKVVELYYLQSLFSTNYQQYKVNLLNANNRILWTGFITPELYSQEFSGFLFELEIECISALATLEYIKFDVNKPIISLMELIMNAVIKTKGDYNSVYIPVVYGDTQSNILNVMNVSTGNFIDEEGEKMNYKEILSEICKFLGWTITERDGNIYFVDVDYITQKQSKYFKYNAAFNNVEVVDLPTNEISIQSLSSKGIDNTLSLLGGFNKVSVIASDYEVDEKVLYPEPDTTAKKPLHDFTTTIDNTLHMKSYFFSDKFKCFKYERSGNTFIEAVTPTANSTIHAGCELIQRTSYEHNNIPNKLNYETLFQTKLFVNDDHSLLLDSFADTQFPILTTDEPSPVLLFSKKSKLCISFKIQYSDRPDGWTVSNNKDDVVDKGDVNGWYIPCRLRIGEYYYNGTAWTKTVSSFNILTDLQSDRQHFTFDWLNVKNTNTYMNQVENLSGLIIDFDKTLLGDFQMTLYVPQQKQDRYVHRYVFIKDIEINSQRIGILSEAKKDTLYTNVINEGYINELEDIELKLTSENESNLSFSKIIINNEVLDTISNKITNTSEKPEKIIINRIINQYNKPKLKLTNILTTDVTPYQLITDNNLSGVKFIVTNENIDYYYNEDTITLIETN